MASCQHADDCAGLAQYAEVQHQRARWLTRLYAAPAGQQPIPGQLLTNRDLARVGCLSGGRADRDWHSHERRERGAAEYRQLLAADSLGHADYLQPVDRDDLVYLLVRQVRQ